MDIANDYLRKRSIKKIVYSAIFVLLLFSVIFRIVDHKWKNVVMSDGKGYYAYLPALIIFHDLDYSFYTDGKAGENVKETSSFIYFIDGAHVNKYPAGVALLQLPFFLIAALITLIVGFPMTGYSFFFELFMSFSAIFYSLVGSYYLFRLLLSFQIAERKALWTSFLILFGTNLLNYTVFEPSMSHCYSYAAVAGFAFYLRRYFLENKRTDWLKACLLLGMILLIRQINGLVLLAVPMIAGELSTLNTGIMQLFRKPFVLVSGILISAAVLSIQPILWHAQNGHWFVWTYLNEGFNWNHPPILKVLFSYRKGWLLYSPLFIFLLPAFIYLLIKKRWYLFFANILFWFPLIYVISSWWCWYYGGSFGQRAFIDFYPLAAISLGLLFNGVLSRGFQIAGSILLALPLILNLIQSYQYAKNIIHYDRMDKDKYWEVFLHTGSDYRFKVFVNENKEAPNNLPGTLTNSWFTDFDEGGSEWVSWRNDDIADEALSGNKVIILKAGNENSPTLKVDVSKDALDSTQLLVQFWYKGSNIAPEAELVVSIDDTTGGTPFRISFPVNDLNVIDKKRDWSKVQVTISPANLSYEGKYKLNVYLYNTGEQAMMFDDVAVFLYKSNQ